MPTPNQAPGHLTWGVVIPRGDPTVATRPCLGSSLHPMGHTLVTGANRCPPCRARVEAARAPRPTTLSRTNAERQRRAQAVTQWRATFGNVCPGWKRDAHGVTPPNILTADHTTAIAAGGPPDGPLTILCRDCNGAKDARTGR